MRGPSGDQTLIQRSLRPVVTGIVAGVLLTVLVLLLFSVVVSMRDVPQAMIDPMAIFSLCAGAFLAGFVCSRKTRSSGLAYGALCGAILSLIVLVAGLISGAGGIGVPALFRIVFLMLCAMIGGVLGVNVRKRRR